MQVIFEGATPWEGREPLPVREGDTVIVSKGTLVRSFHPSRKERVLVRDQRVTVDHILNESWEAIAYTYEDQPGRVVWNMHDHEVDGLLDSLGLPRRTSVERTASIHKLLHEITAITYPYGPDRRTTRRHWLRKSEATVNWAGSGGYWTWAPISGVRKVEGA